MGFGFPLAATTFFDPMTAGCAFGVLFPMSILAAHLAKSPQEETLFRLRYKIQFFIMAASSDI